MLMVGRISDTSAISMRPIRSGKKRSRALTCSAVSAGSPVLLVAEADVVEAHRSGREQRDRGAAAQHRIEAGDGADFGLDGLAHGIGRDQKRHHHEDAEARDRQGCNGKSKRA